MEQCRVYLTDIPRQMPFDEEFPNALEDETPPAPLIDVQTRLHDAAAFGNVIALAAILSSAEVATTEIMEKLASQDLNRPHQNALHQAASFQGNPEYGCACVEAILTFAKNNSDQDGFLKFVNARDDEGATPLYLAVKYENEGAVRILVRSGGNLDIPNNRSRTALRKIFKKMPSVIHEMWRDDGMKGSHFIDEKRENLHLYFRMLVGTPTKDEAAFPLALVEMHFLSNICFTPIKKRAPILRDTFVKTFVSLKWQHYRLWFWFGRLFQGAILTARLEKWKVAFQGFGRLLNAFFSV